MFRARPPGGICRLSLLRRIISPPYRPSDRRTTMPFVFWGGTDAEEEFRKDLTVFYEKYQYKGSYPKARLEDVFDDLRTWCRKSPTARAILDYVDTSSSEVHVVGMSGGFQCFNSTSGRDDRKGTIFIDLDARTDIL